LMHPYTHKDMLLTVHRLTKIMPPIFIIIRYSHLKIGVWCIQYVYLYELAMGPKYNIMCLCIFITSFCTLLISIRKLHQSVQQAHLASSLSLHILYNRKSLKNVEQRKRHMIWSWDIE
jgi:hypothetical protein